MSDTPAAEIKIDAVPQGKWKALGGSDRDQWNVAFQRSLLGHFRSTKRTSRLFRKPGPQLLLASWHEARRPD
jgi:hypothetical protein